MLIVLARNEFLSLRLMMLLPVVVKSAVPAAISSLPPIEVKLLPQPDWLTEVGIFAATVAASFSILAVCIALSTLDKVKKQIAIANDQVGLAREELKVVKEDLRLTEASNALVMKSLEHSATQVAYISRKAKLSLWPSRDKVPNMFWISDQPDEVQVRARLWLCNDGDNTARTASLILLMPECWKPPNWDGKHDAAPAFAVEGFQLISNVPTDYDGRRWYLVAAVKSPIYPSLEVLAIEFNIVVPQGFDGDLLWRVAYDDGVEPPQDEPSRRIHYTVRPSGRDSLGVTVSPSCHRG